jgi:hypothetical protein
VALVMLTRVITTPAIATDSILFSGATVDRLRRIGWFVVIASVILWVFSIATWNLLRASLPPGIFPAAPPSVMGEPLTGPSLTLGIVILVVAWIIQRGRVMREDLAGVI